MAEAITGHEFLIKLRDQGSRSYQYYDTLYDHLERKAREKGIPLNGQYELTPLCNFDCKMCYTHLTKEQMQGKPLLTVDQWKQITDEAYAAGMMRVNLTGGECLTYPGFEELYLYLHSLGIEIRVLTNASLMNDAWISFFRKHPPILIQISLYGGDEETYERVTGHQMFHAVSANIRKAIKSELPVTIATTPSKYAGAGMLGTIRAAHEFNVPFSIAPYLTDPKELTGRSGQDHELSLEDYVTLFRYRYELEGIELPSANPETLPPPGGPYHECNICGLNCGGGLSSFDIDWQGKMSTCNECRTAYAYPLEEGFLPAWKKIHETAANWPRVPECIDCPYENVCTNCEIKKTYLAGPGKQPLTLCMRTKYLAQHGVYKIPACK